MPQVVAVGTAVLVFLMTMAAGVADEHPLPDGSEGGFP